MGCRRKIALLSRPDSSLLSFLGAQNPLRFESMASVVNAKVAKAE